MSAFSSVDCSGHSPAPADHLASVAGQVPSRWERVARLLGDAAVARLAQARVVVVGLGGVGSYAAESLLRSGIGGVRLVDFDNVCMTNFNRQIEACMPALGRPKATALADRLRSIDPNAHIEPMVTAFGPETASEVLADSPDLVVDAIDNLTSKGHLLSVCRDQAIPVVSSLGAAGRCDPTAVRIADLAHSRQDPMGRTLRKMLRQRWGFPRQGRFGILAVFSVEKPQGPSDCRHPWSDDQRDSSETGTEATADSKRHRLMLGSASFVTGTFGLFCAFAAVQTLVGTDFTASR